MLFAYPTSCFADCAHAELQTPLDLLSNLQFFFLTPGQIWPLSVAVTASVAHIMKGLLSHVGSKPYPSLNDGLKNPTNAQLISAWA